MHAKMGQYVRRKPLRLMGSGAQLPLYQQLVLDHDDVVLSATKNNSQLITRFQFYFHQFNPIIHSMIDSTVYFLSHSSVRTSVLLIAGALLFGLGLLMIPSRSHD